VSRPKIKPPSPQGGLKILIPSTIQMEAFDHPVFCFKHTHKDYGIDGCSDEEKRALITKLGELSKMTWHQIQSAHRHGAGSEKISRKSLNVHPPTFITKDVDHLLALRFKGKAPMLVHRNRFVMHVIFIDPKFQVYNH
jgi:hypothetical protein